MDDVEILPNGSECSVGRRTSAHTNSSKQRVEVITWGARRNRRPEEKLEIVLASLEPGAMPLKICRQYGIGSGQLTVWRPQLRDGELGDASLPIVNFAQAVMAQALAVVAAKESSPIPGRPTAHHVGPRPAARR